MRPWNLLCLLAALVGLLPLRAWSCQCYMPRSPAEAVRGATAVFHGRVLSATQGPPYISPRLVRLQVLRAWKGPVEPEITLHTGWGDGDCGFEFKEGAEYLVYGYPSDWNPSNGPSSDGSTQLMAHICSRTEEIESAAEDLKYLEAGSTQVVGARRHFTPGALSCAATPEGLWPVALLALVGLASRRSLSRP